MDRRTSSRSNSQVTKNNHAAEKIAKLRKPNPYAFGPQAPQLDRARGLKREHLAEPSGLAPDTFHCEVVSDQCGAAQELRA